MEEFYRYTDSHDAYGYAHITLSIYILLRETNCGYWVIPKWAKSDSEREKYKKWIPRDSKKRFAYPTKEEALINFKKRKAMQIFWGEYNISRAKQALSKIEDLEKEIDNNG
jgi:hypothetical protein